MTLGVGPDEIVMVVADRGPGVPPDRLQRIFERFYKADPSRHGGSSGLGLAIAAEHAALLGGYLMAANRAGGGLRIELRLPVTGSLPPGDVAANGGAEAGTPIRPHTGAHAMNARSHHSSSSQPSLVVLAACNASTGGPRLRCRAPSPTPSADPAART